MIRTSTVLLALLIASLLIPGIRGEEQVADPDAATLTRAGIKTDDASLLAFLRERTAPDEDLQNISRFIDQLGSAEAKEREDASKRLGRLGVLTLPKLRQAAGDKDPERAARARARIEAISHPTWVLPAAAVRLLLKRNPDGTGEALFRYLPFVQSEETEEDIWFGLDRLAAWDVKLRFVLLTGMKDALPSRRALAACVVGHVGTAGQREAVRPLLEDKDPTVRLRAAQGLLSGKDKGGVPVLVALLEDTPAEVAWQAEELLIWVSGKDSLGPMVGTGTPEARRKARLAWENWWAREGEALDLARLKESPRRPGLVLIAEAGPVRWGKGGGWGGRVWLTGCDGEARWEFAVPRHPEDVRLLPGPRVLLAESEEWLINPGFGRPPEYRLTERDLAGRVAWEVKLDARPRACQRLPDGRTFVAAGDALTVDPSGKEASRLRFGGREDKVWCEHPLLGGAVVCSVRKPGDFTGLKAYDPLTGKVLRRLPFDHDRNARVEGIPGAGYLIAQADPTRVMWMDVEGKVVWRVSPADVRHAVPLRNGNALVACRPRGSAIIEIDQEGRTVWEVLCEGTPQRVRVCFGLLRLGLHALRPDDFDLNATVEAQLAGLTRDKAGVRCVSARRLERLGEARKYIDELIDAADHQDEGVQEVIASVLGKIGPGAVPKLLKAVKDPRPKVRGAVIWALADYQKDDEAVRKAIVAATEDENDFVRFHAVRMLYTIGPSETRVISALIRELSKQDDAKSGDKLRAVRMAAHILGTFGPCSKGAVEQLQKAIRHRELDVRRNAILALGSIGEEAASAADDLLDILKKEPAGDLATSAAWALGQFRSRAKRAVPLLTALCGDPSLYKELRISAIQALVEIGWEAASSIPTIKQLVQDKDEDVRKAAVAALKQLDP
jgi:HEAT repeat protein